MADRLLLQNLPRTIVPSNRIPIPAPAFPVIPLHAVTTPSVHPSPSVTPITRGGVPIPSCPTGAATTTVRQPAKHRRISTADVMGGVCTRCAGVPSRKERGGVAERVSALTAKGGISERGECSWVGVMGMGMGWGWTSRTVLPMPESKTPGVPRNGGGVGVGWFNHLVRPCQIIRIGKNNLSCQR